MKMRDANGNPSHSIIGNLINIASYQKMFMELLQKSAGINTTDNYLQETYAQWSGVFYLADGITKSDPVLIKANLTGSASNQFITGDGIKTIATLVGALIPDYTIVGDGGSQVLHSGDVISITGGYNKADDVAAQNAKQEKFAALIKAEADAIAAFYSGL
jgi:hypothetical protein